MLACPKETVTASRVTHQYPDWKPQGTMESTFKATTFSPAASGVENQILPTYLAEWSDREPSYSTIDSSSRAVLFCRIENK